MSDSTGTLEAPATPLATPEVTPPATETEKPLTAEDAAFWRKEAKEKANAEAALRKRLKDLERAEEARQQAEMSEAERLQAELAELKTEREELLTFKQQTAVRDAVSNAARDPQLGARRPEALHKLVDAAALQFDESGAVVLKSLEAELLRIKDDFPELFYVSGGSINGGDGQGIAQPFDMNTIIRRRVGH